MSGGGGSTPAEVIQPERRWIDQVYNMFQWRKGGAMVGGLVKAMQYEGGVHLMWGELVVRPGGGWTRGRNVSSNHPLQSCRALVNCCSCLCDICTQICIVQDMHV